MSEMGELSIRDATVNDARGVAIVHVESWRAAYRGLIADDVLDALRVDTRTEGWSRWIAASPGEGRVDSDANHAHRLLVAEVDATIVGWASFGAGRDDGMNERGELAGIYVSPNYWSRRVGHTLITRVEQELSRAGWTEAYLWVLAGNERAIHFYEAHGWHADGREKVGSAGGANDLHELLYVRLLPPASRSR